MLYGKAFHPALRRWPDRGESPGRLFRLGLSTGTTPVTLYEELARRCQEGEVSFQDVEVFSIDEYYPSSQDEYQSRNHLLRETLLDQLGFNEAGSNEITRTRTVRLSYSSRKQQALHFNHDLAATPQSAITMGLGTMLSAGRIALMAWGEDKAEAVRAIVEGDMTTACPASVLPSCPPLRPSPPSFAGLTGESPPLEINKKAPSAVLWLLISPVKCPKTGRTGEGFTFRGTQKCTFVWICFQNGSDYPGECVSLDR